jgi:hypothetical protein
VPCRLLRDSICLAPPPHAPPRPPPPCGRCWRCGKEIDGYRHFRTGECILFDEAEILRWAAASGQLLLLRLACLYRGAPPTRGHLPGYLRQTHASLSLVCWIRWVVNLPHSRIFRRWEAQWEEMEAAARVFAAGVRNELVGETAARRDGRPRGCHCPQCGQVNHKLGEQPAPCFDLILFEPCRVRWGGGAGFCIAGPEAVASQLGGIQTSQPKYVLACATCMAHPRPLCCSRSILLPSCPPPHPTPPPSPMQATTT